MNRPLIACTMALLPAAFGCTPPGGGAAPEAPAAGATPSSASVPPASTATSTPGGADRTAERPLPPQDADDPFLWLEEVEGDRPLAWVEERNARTLDQLEESPAFRPIFDRTLAILDSRDRIAQPAILGDRLYNFWQDAANPRGIWRRTTWESYLSGSPDWEVVIDVDALASAEGIPWSFGGASCLAPDYRRCLVALSRGGADAVEMREFDLTEKLFIDDGFRLAEAKQSMAWVDENTLLVSTNFGDGSMTASGYPRIARIWRRGTPLSAARTIFTASAEDVGVWTGSWETTEGTIDVVVHRPGFFETATHVLRGEELVRLELPLDADPHLVGERLVVYLRSPWEIDGRAFPAGSLVHTDYDAFVAGEGAFDLLLAANERQTINEVSATRDHLLVGLLDNVSGELRRYTFEEGRWTFELVPAPPLGSIVVTATSPHDNRFFFTYSGFTQPTTLYLGEDGGAVREIQRMPAMFDATRLIVEQQEATSSDGTRIPYFVVRPEGARMDGTNPTLLYAYGGFEVAMTPAYSPATGAAWLERGGVYVVANIRGGGEFGPAWHRAAKLENRQRAYDDFLAVAEGLIASGLTSPEHLGIMGGSNGGLLVGAALTQRPELFDAVVVQVPLLDMRRYHRLLAGASWMAEYGDPDDPAQWEFIGRYSPYQNVRPAMPYPRVLFTTTTRDDRVHPGHARKMAARMESLGYPVLYFENTEGGHGAGVTSEQRARMQAVTFTYLWEQLGDGEARP